MLARVAKLVDALCSGRSVRKDVMVRIHSWALILKRSYTSLFLLAKFTTADQAESLQKFVPNYVNSHTDKVFCCSIFQQ